MLYTTALSIFEEHIQFSECDPKQASQQVSTSHSLKLNAVSQSRAASLSACQSRVHWQIYGILGSGGGGHVVWLMWNGQWPEGNPSLGLIILSLWWDGKLEGALRFRPQLLPDFQRLISATALHREVFIKDVLEHFFKKVQKSTLRKCEV